MIYEILDSNGDIENRIEASQAFVDQYHPGRWRLADVQPEPVTTTEPRHISVGAFFDRFEPIKWTILADPSPQVQAVIKDASVRPYIDLDRADLPAGLQVLIDAGHAIDSEAILTAPVQPHEVP